MIENVISSPSSNNVGAWKLSMTGASLSGTWILVERLLSSNFESCDESYNDRLKLYVPASSNSIEIVNASSS